MRLKFKNPLQIPLKSPNKKKRSKSPNRKHERSPQSKNERSNRDFEARPILTHKEMTKLNYLRYKKLNEKKSK